MLNASQKKIAELLDGMIVVDAGPGTGKTHTLVERYLNILKQPETEVEDVIFLTFTRNSAREIRDRLTERILSLEEDKKQVCKNISPEALSVMLRVGTFDSLCLSILKENPETISKFFQIPSKLQRDIRITENETLNEMRFSRFADDFIVENLDKYPDECIILNQFKDDGYKIISKMLSRGIIPYKEGWFSGQEILLGNNQGLEEILKNKNTSKLSGELYKFIKDHDVGIDVDTKSPLPEDMLNEIVDEDRTGLVDFIHDLYYAYICRCIEENNLTFGLTAAFAFILLYVDERVRRKVSCRYLMIDEFQDTNQLQMIVSLLLLRENNLCAVGDWRQSIYGFRNADVDNIRCFSERVKDSLNFINSGEKRVEYSIEDVKELAFDVNYRSSQDIINTCFKTMDEVPSLTTGREKLTETEISFVKAEDRNEEIEEVIRRIDNYVHSGKYVMHGKDGSIRPIEYGDIAVLCRSGSVCRQVQEAAESHGIPTYLQGDREVMSSKEGKLLLAWLRYVRNEKDVTGLIPILYDAGMSPDTILDIVEGVKNDDIDSIPPEFIEMRNLLIEKKNDLLDLTASIFEMYGISNDVTAAAVAIVSICESEGLSLTELINLIEVDIKKERSYTVDTPLKKNAVIIQTIHKAKGMEYPAVIIPRVDLYSFPSTKGDSSIYFINDIAGLRCKREIIHDSENFSIMHSWRSFMIQKTAEKKDDEEQRLMFVALSRAEQYITVIASDPSKLYKDICVGEECCLEGCLDNVEDFKDLPLTCPLAEISGIAYNKMGVHDLLEFKSDFKMESSVSSEGGMAFGTKIHEIANDLAEGVPIDENEIYVKNIQKVLDSLNGAELLSEIECALPIPEHSVSLNGIIDLLAVFPDRVEVHDYKTDKSKKFEEQYVIQLSVYAHAAAGHYQRPVRCVIDYLRLDERFEFDPICIDEINSIVYDNLIKSKKEEF